MIVVIVVIVAALPTTSSRPSSSLLLCPLLSSLSHHHDCRHQFWSGRRRCGTVELGLNQLGYNYLNLDDCWAKGRNDDGTVYADKAISG